MKSSRQSYTGAMSQFILINLAIVGTAALTTQRGPKTRRGGVPPAPPHASHHQHNPSNPNNHHKAELPPAPRLSLQQLSDSIHQQISQLPIREQEADAKNFPVPTTSICAVIICCQFVAVYTALALCRTYHELTSSPKARLESALRAAAQTVMYGPMLCVLFIAYQMRVEYLSHGKAEPQQWVQSCMYALTFAVMVSTVLTLFLQLITGKPLPSKDRVFDLERPTLEDGYSKPAFYILSFMRYLVLVSLYLGLAGVILGICTYLPPGSANLSDVEAPAPAVMCTMILAVVFFSTQLVIAVCRSYLEFTCVEFPQLVGMMHAAATTMEFAPMLAVLFITARMQALQYGAQPQEWAQSCMYASTGAMCVTSLLAIMVPATLGGTLKTNPWTHEVFVEVPNPMLGYIFVFLRFVCMFCFYAGALGVIVSISIFESPGPMETLPMSPTVRCVVNLTCQFFLVYFVMSVMLTVSELTGGMIPMEKWRLFSAVEAARSTLAFAPMLSILCITTRMHALAITNQTGAPQAWTQDAMYMAAWSLQMAGLMCLGSGLIMDKVECDYDGNVINKFTNWYIGSLTVAIRYFSMVLLYGGMLLIVFGLFTMTPENAHGRGSVPLDSAVFRSAAATAAALKPTH